MARRRKKRSSPLPVLILFAAAALLTVGLVKLYPQMQESSATADLNSYFGVSDGEAALVVNNEILDARGVVKDDDIYVDYDTVTKYFNDMFCWDKDSQQMLLTLPKGTEIYKDGDGSLLLIDGKPYLSASCIKEDSDIDMEVYDSPERIVARTVWDNVPTETVTQDTKLRTAEGKRSEILTSLSRGDTVILTQNADKWCCVSTSDGLMVDMLTFDLALTDMTALDLTITDIFTCDALRFDVTALDFAVLDVTALDFLLTDVIASDGLRYDMLTLDLALTDVLTSYGLMVNVHTLYLALTDIQAFYLTITDIPRFHLTVANVTGFDLVVSDVSTSDGSVLDMLAFDFVLTDVLTGNLTVTNLIASDCAVLELVASDGLVCQHTTFKRSVFDADSGNGSVGNMA